MTGAHHLARITPLRQIEPQAAFSTRLSIETFLAVVYASETLVVMEVESFCAVEALEDVGGVAVVAVGQALHAGTCR